MNTRSSYPAFAKRKMQSANSLRDQARKTRANPHPPGPSSSFLGSSNPLQKNILPLFPNSNENDPLLYLNETNF